MHRMVLPYDKRCFKLRHVLARPFYPLRDVYDLAGAPRAVSVSSVDGIIFAEPHVGPRFGLPRELAFAPQINSPGELPSIKRAL